MVYPRCTLLVLWFSLAQAERVPQKDLEAALSRVAEQMATKYNMSIAVAFHSPDAVFSVAAGYTDAGLGMGTRSRPAHPHDMYVWGSTTKMFTAPAVLQLVGRGIVSLTDPIAMHVDPLLVQLNGTRLADHFGHPINSVHVEHLLHMTSGIADYDDGAFAEDQLTHRAKAFGPVEILGKYVRPSLLFAPGQRQQYCSTNYILLGLILARYSHRIGTPWSWQAYDQLTVIPAPLRNAFNESKFVVSGPCNKFTPVHGFMASYSTAAILPQDVWNVSCVGGWTAGNYVGSVADVARFTYELYAKNDSRIVPPALQAYLTNFSAPAAPGRKFKFYGMGTFSLDWSIGDAEAYGHVGDTYGYQSQTTYFPGLGFVLAVATNVETASQAQPADATCIAYHEIAALMHGKEPPSCSFKVPFRFIGQCTCNYDVVV